MPGQHALLSPSASKRWLSCPPSARLSAKLDLVFGDRSSIYAEEGTKAHSLSELKLRHETGEINDFNFKTRVGALGEIPSEMDRYTNAYVDVVLEKLYAARRSDPEAELYIEQKLDMNNWVPKCFGTSDAVVVSNDILEVMDLKYGAGIPVVAEDNPQARLYGLGAYEAFREKRSFPRVRNTIIQPRLDSVTDETLSVEELLAWGEAIKPLAELAWRGEGDFKTGDHCRFCSAKAICAARAAEVMELFKHGFDEPGVIPDADIPRILEVADTAEKWLKDIRAYALAQASQGQMWRGWKLTRGKRPNRSWSSEEEVREQLIRAGYDEDSYTTTKMKGVTDLEKLLGKAAFSALLGEYVSQGEGKLELVPEDDKRIEFTPAEAAFSDMFDDKGENER